MARARTVVGALFAAVAAASGAGVAGRESPARAGAGAGVERYVYRASPADAKSGSEETHRVTVTTDASGTTYEFRIEFDRGLVDRGFVRVSPLGEFESAVRHRLGRDGVRYETDSLRVEGSLLVMDRWRDGKLKTSRARLPADRPRAVDASLLLWMRAFPFGDPAARDVFMADWSHRTVDVDVRDRGVESVTVPAGTFACHRMEVTVKVFVFRPKITFWITVDEPHFLVQHEGKRGPFTPVFHTRLVEREASWSRP